MADIVSLLETVSTALNDFSVARPNARLRNLHGQTAIVATKEILDILSSNTTKALKTLWKTNPAFADPAAQAIIDSIDDSGQGISDTLEHKLHLLKQIAQAMPTPLLPDDTAIAAQLAAIAGDTSLPARQIRTTLEGFTHFQDGLKTGITLSSRSSHTPPQTIYSHPNPEHSATINFNNSFGATADLIGIQARVDKEQVIERLKNDTRQMRRIYKEQFFPEIEEYLKLEAQLKKLKHYNLLDFSAPVNWHPVAQNIVLKIRSGLLYLDKIPLLRPFHRIGQLMAFFDKDRHELENISARLVDMETKFTMDIMPAMRKNFASIALCDKAMYKKAIGDLCREDPEFFLFQDKKITGRNQVELNTIIDPTAQTAKKRLLKQQLKEAGISSMLANFDFRQSSEGQTQGFLSLDILSQIRFKEMEAEIDNSGKTTRASLFERLFHDAPAKTAGMMQKYFVNGDPHLNVGAFQHFAGQRMLTNIHEAERLLNPLRYTVNSRTQGFHLNQNSRKDEGLWLAKKFCRFWNNRKENQEEPNNLSYVFKQQYRQITQPLGFITKPIVSLLNLIGLAGPLRTIGLIRNNELMLPGLRSIQAVLPFKEKSSLQESLNIDYDYFMGVRVFDAFHRYKEFTTTWTKQTDSPTPGNNLASAAEDLANALRDSFILAARSNKAPSSAVCRRFLGQGQNSESPKQWGEIYAAIAKDIRIPYEIARKPGSRLDTRMPTPADLNPYSDRYEPYGFLKIDPITGKEEWAFRDSDAKQQFEKQLAKSQALSDELKEAIDRGSKQAQQIVNEVSPMLSDYVDFLRTQPPKEAIQYTPVRTTPSPHASTTRYLELPNNAAVQKTDVADLITIALNEARRNSLSNNPESLEARNSFVPFSPLVRAMRERANTY